MWGTSQLSNQFHGLEIWTDYKVKVCAFTSKGNGLYSANIPANTDKDGKMDGQLMCPFPQGCY